MSSFTCLEVGFIVFLRFRSEPTCCRSFPFRLACCQRDFESQPNVTEHRRPHKQATAPRPTQVRADEPEPGEIDEGAPSSDNEQPVAARGRHAQNADALASPGDRIASAVMTSKSERRSRRTGPSARSMPSTTKSIGHPPRRGPGRSPWRCSCGRTRSRARRARWSARRPPQAGPNPYRRPKPCGSWWRRSAWR